MNAFIAKAAEEKKMDQTTALQHMSDRFLLLGSGKADAMPKYQKVCEVIRELIQKQEFDPGDRLPPEADMAKTLSVSLGTMRNALNALSSEGIVRREQGRGTFVANRPSELIDLWHFRFCETNGDQMIPVYTSVLSLDKVRDEGPWSVFLGKDSHYVRISRLIDIGHECCAVGQYYLRGDQFSDLLDEDLEQFEGVHLRNILKDRYGLPTLTIEERVSAERLPDAVCHWLDLPFFSIGLVCQILGDTYQRAPLSFQHVFIPANSRPLQVREAYPYSEKK